MRKLLLLSAVWLGVHNVSGTTLQELSLSDLIQKSTAIVHGTVKQTYTATHGSIIYTHYSVQVSEQWKGSQSTSVDLAVPGGTLNHFTQNYAGAPELTTGQDYVIFLWTGGKSRLTHVIGLSQGLFTIQATVGGLMAVRSPSAQHVVDSGGNSVPDASMAFNLNDLRSRVLSGKGTGTL